MAVATAHRPRPPGAGWLATALERGKVIGFKGGEGSIDHFPARHDDHIQAGVKLVPPEQFPGQPFGSVPDDGSTHLPCGCNTYSWCPTTVFHDEHGHIPALNPNARIVGTLEFRASPHALRPPERLACGFSLRRQPSDACALSLGVVSGQSGRSSSTSAPGSHVSWPGGGCSAGRYAFPSSISPSVPRNGTCQKPVSGLRTKPQ